MFHFLISIINVYKKKVILGVKCKFFPKTIVINIVILVNSCMYFGDSNNG